MCGPQEAFDTILDPAKKEREEEAKLRKEVKASKKQWRMIRKQRFAFLDEDGGDVSRAIEEKKVDTGVVAK